MKEIEEQSEEQERERERKSKEGFLISLDLKNVITIGYKRHKQNRIGLL